MQGARDPLRAPWVSSGWLSAAALGVFVLALPSASQGQARAAPGRGAAPGGGAAPLDGRAPLDGLATEGAPRVSAAQGPSPQRGSRSILPLLAPLSATPEARALVAGLKQHHWRLDPPRHNPLAKPDRGFLRLVTFLRESTAGWMRGDPWPPTSQRGPVRLRLGKPTRWPSANLVLEIRRSLLLPASAEAEARIRIPPRGELRFDLGLVPLGRGTAPPRLIVTLRPEDPPEEIQLIDRPLEAASAGRWVETRVDLARWAGRRARLILEVRSQAARNARDLGVVALGDPRVVGEEPSRRPNLLLVMLDTVRPDAISAYGAPAGSTPHLDRIARGGARFTEAFTGAPWTRPSMMSLASSLTPGRAASSPQQFVPRPVDRWVIENRGPPTIYDHLQGQGYRVRGLVNDFFMIPHEEIGLDHGIGDLAHIQWGQGRTRMDNEAITRQAERFLKASAHERFFLLVIYESAHSPYAPPLGAEARYRALRGMDSKRRLSMSEAYAAEVMALDDHVGRLTAALDAAGLTEDTLLVVTADHGETLSQHHCFTIPRLKYDSCYSHSAAVYDEVLRVPLLFRGPGVARGRVVAQTTRLIDLVPTALDLLGLPPLSGAQGLSVAPHLRAGHKPPALVERDVYALGRWIWGLRRGRHKIILRAPGAQSLLRQGRVEEVPMELYDLEADPEERRNLARSQPALAARLAAALRAHIAEDRWPPPPDLPARFRAQEGLWPKGTRPKGTRPPRIPAPAPTR